MGQRQSKSDGQLTLRTKLETPKPNRLRSRGQSQGRSLWRSRFHFRSCEDSVARKSIGDSSFQSIPDSEFINPPNAPPNSKEVTSRSSVTLHYIRSKVNKFFRLNVQSAVTDESRHDFNSNDPSNLEMVDENNNILKRTGSATKRTPRDEKGRQNAKIPRKMDPQCSSPFGTALKRTLVVATAVVDENQDQGANHGEDSGSGSVPESSDISSHSGPRSPSGTATTTVTSTTASPPETPSQEPEEETKHISKRPPAPRRKDKKVVPPSPLSPPPKIQINQFSTTPEMTPLVETSTTGQEEAFISSTADSCDSSMYARKKCYRSSRTRKRSPLKKGCCAPTAPPAFLDYGPRYSSAPRTGNIMLDRLKHVDVIEELQYHVPGGDGEAGSEDFEYYYQCNECGEMEPCSAGNKGSEKPVTYSRRQRFNFQHADQEVDGPPFCQPNSNACPCFCCRAGLRRNPNCGCNCCNSKGRYRVVNCFDEIPVGKNPQFGSCCSLSDSQTSSQGVLPNNSGVYFYDAEGKVFVPQDPRTPTPLVVDDPCTTAVTDSDGTYTPNLTRLDCKDTHGQPVVLPAVQGNSQNIDLIAQTLEAAIRQQCMGGGATPHRQGNNGQR